MKALIGRTVGALSIGSMLLLVSGCREATSVASAYTTPGGALVNCGEGRQALVRPVTAGSNATQVECVPVSTAPAELAYASMDRSLSPMLIPAVARPAAERVVYREAPAAERVVDRGAPTSTRRAPAERPRATRSWKKSAVIIGGSAAGGAGLGAILGGGGGAKKGAVVGGIAGTVYDIATRNK